MKLKVGDWVLINAGRDKGKTGKVTKVLPKRQQVLVEGVGLYTKHRKPYAGQSGERLGIHKPVNSAKARLVNSQGELDKIGYKLLKDGSKIRFFKKSGEQIADTVSENKLVRKSVKSKADSSLTKSKSKPRIKPVWLEVKSKSSKPTKPAKKSK